MKNLSSEIRHKATLGAHKCLVVMRKLSKVYGAARYALGFLEAVMRKMGIDGDIFSPSSKLTTSAFSKLRTRGRGKEGLSSSTASNAENIRSPDSVMSPSAVDDMVTLFSDFTNDVSYNDGSGKSKTVVSSGCSEMLTPDIEPMGFDFSHIDLDWEAFFGTSFDAAQWQYSATHGVLNDNATPV
jgi:hypothetical protein